MSTSPHVKDPHENDPFEDSGSEYVPSNPSGSESESERDEATTSATVKTRKRIRNEKIWPRNVMKAKRIKGEEYKNFKGRVVPPKLFEEIVCPCSNQCHVKINAERQKTLLETFYRLETHDLQTSYIFGLVEVVNKLRCYKTNADPSRRSNTRLYYLTNENGEKVKICKEFFKKVLKVSDGRISRIMLSKAAGMTPPVDKRGKHAPSNKTSEERILEIKNFINRFPAYQSHYSRIKNPHRKYLSPDLSLGKMYSLYKDQTPEPASYFVFANVFNKQFNLHFHAPVSDSCRKCDFLKVKIEASTDEAAKQQLITERELHLRKAESAREGMKADAGLARNDKNITVISFDLMKTLATPVLSTGIAYYKRQLWTFCLGIHNLATNEAFIYVWDESKASRGPDEIGSCLLHFVKNYVVSKKLILYSDQCGGQNRNIKIALLCNFIVSSGNYTVDEIDQKFLVSGHSYLACDQDFGLIEKQKKFYKDIYIPEHWCNVIRSARKKNPFKIVVMTSQDFFSTASLQSQITNRKKSINDEKVEWLKMQWLKFKKDEPFLIHFKYSNNDCVAFKTVNIAKRNAATSSVNNNLQLLYPNGHKIDIKKKQDLLTLSDFIPPVYHQFYQNLKTTEEQSEDFIEMEENNDE